MAFKHMRSRLMLHDVLSVDQSRGNSELVGVPLSHQGICEPWGAMGHRAPRLDRTVLHRVSHSQWTEMDKQSSSPLAHPMVFLMSHQIVLTLIMSHPIPFSSRCSQLSGHHRLSIFRNRFSSLFCAIHTMYTMCHPDLALSIGFEIVSLPDTVAQTSSHTSVPQQ